MHPAESNADPLPSAIPPHDDAPDAVPSTPMPTFFATDLLEKLIGDRDAAAVHRIVTAGRRTS